jgi:hypothetical protein
MNEKVVTGYDRVSFEQRRGVGISSRRVVNQTGSFIESIDSHGITGWEISRGIYLRAPRDELSSNGPIGMLTFVKRYTGSGTTKFIQKFTVRVDKDCDHESFEVYKDEKQKLVVMKVSMSKEAPPFWKVLVLHDPERDINVEDRGPIFSVIKDPVSQGLYRGTGIFCADLMAAATLQILGSSNSRLVTCLVGRGSNRWP